jgi:RNA polymerase sigma factor (sigma-70 family)
MGPSLIHVHTAATVRDDELRAAAAWRLAKADRLAARRRLPRDPGEVERLVIAASAGDTAAWSSLVNRFAARLRAVVRGHRLAAQDAEDVVQTTWLRLLEHIDRVREPFAVGAWLETTARRESLRVLRASQRERPTESERLDFEPVAPVAERRLVASDDRVALARAMTALAPRDRQLLSTLFADPAPSYEEISRTLGIPIGSIGPTRGRILARLRRDPALAWRVQ